MSAALWSQVERLYALLDLDENGRLDRDEARLGFSSCFADVHRATERLSDDKAAVVEQQVSWLFSATEHTHEGEEVSLAEFRACYDRLLKNAMEEEVLLLDLKRAIDSLSGSQEWTLTRKLFQTAKQVFRSVAGDAADARLLSSDARARSVLERAFVGITGRSQVLGPKRQTAARRLVAPALAADAPPLSVQGLLALYKQLLAVPVPVDALAEDAQAALQLASGEGGQAAGSAASAAPAQAASMDS